MKIANLSIMTLLMLASIALGTTYAVFNTDPHHWGFIAGTILDFIHGNELFSEIYIQYGIGQALFFKALQPWAIVNYTSLGIWTSAVYSFQLLIFFLCLRKILPPLGAILGIVIFFLIHPYAIYPWPDYWAGLCLSLACYFLILSVRTSGKKYINLLPGICLFFSFVFRHTYGIGILLSFSIYGIAAFLRPALREKILFLTFLVFTGLFGGYLVWLAANGNLLHWYQQCFGAATSQYGIGGSSVLVLLKKVFLPAKFWLPNNQVFLTLSIVFYGALFFAYQMLFRLPSFQKKISGIPSGLFAFFVFLGTAGLLQCTLIYEVFRVQNACLPLFLAWAAFLPKKIEGKWRYAVAFYVVLLLFKLPHASSIFPLYEGERSSYLPVSIPYFKGHLFQEEEKRYYESLASFLCDGKSDIVNRTMDSSIGYLCPEQKSAYPLPFFNPPMMKLVQSEPIERHQKGFFNFNELLVAEKPTAETYLAEVPGIELVKIGEVNRPKSTRFFGANTVFVYRVQQRR